MACASGAPYVGENGKPIGAKKFGYDVSVRPYLSTDSGRRGKNLTGVGKAVPDMYVAFRFCSKSTMDYVLVMSWAFGGTRMALEWHSITHSLTRFSLIFFKSQIKHLPPFLSITFVPSAFYAYASHILEGTSKAYIFPDTHRVASLAEDGFCINDPLLTWRDNGFYDEAGHYLIFQCKLQRWIVKITIAG